MLKAIIENFDHEIKSSQQSRDCLLQFIMIYNNCLHSMYLDQGNQNPLFQSAEVMAASAEN